jgi:predicted component of type VI protein secretion system
MDALLRTRLELHVDVSREQWRRWPEATRPPFPDPEPPEQHLVLDEDRSSVGREHDGDRPGVLLIAGTDAESGISRRHCSFERRHDGCWVVEDCDSRNGTRVNDDGPLATGRQHVLADGDRIYIGAWTRLTVRIVTAG